jgi:exopolysaccharide production protein ExoZ
LNKEYSPPHCALGEQLKTLVSIQYLRAFAALGVVAYHTGRATILGQAGVDVFFVISGFIMWMVTAEPIGPAQFLWHRVVRIVPLYWIATLIMAVYWSSSVSDTVRSLLFWPYRDANGELWPVLVQGWTLNFEMFFYLLFAATLIIPRRFQLLSLTAVLCSLSAIGIAFQPHEAQLWVLTSPFLMEFLAGVWLSEIIQRGKIPGVKIAVAMLFIGLFGFVASLRGPTPELWRFIFWGGPSLLVVCGAISIELRRGLPTIKSLKLLGDGSYSIYLFHPFVLKSVATPLAKFPALICVAAVVIAGAAVGRAAFHMLERPLLTLLRRWTGSVVTAPATVSKSRR